MTVVSGQPRANSFDYLLYLLLPFAIFYLLPVRYTVRSFNFIRSRDSSTAAPLFFFSFVVEWNEEEEEEEKKITDKTLSRPM